MSTQLRILSKNLNESHVLDVACFIRSLLEHLNALLVAGAGLEPARALGPEDFKSAVSTNSTTPPFLGILTHDGSVPKALRVSFRGNSRIRTYDPLGVNEMR